MVRATAIYNTISMSDCSVKLEQYLLFIGLSHSTVRCIKKLPSTDVATDTDTGTDTGVIDNSYGC